MKFKRLLKDYGPSMLTGAGLFGIGLSTFLTSKASIDIYKMLDEHPEWSKKEKIKNAMPKIFAPGATLVGTTTAIITSDFLHAKNTAEACATIAALAGTGCAYVKSVNDNITEDEHKIIRKDFISKLKVKELSTGDEKHFWDESTQSFFNATMQDVENAYDYMLTLFRINGHMHIQDFYDYLEYPEGTEHVYGIDKGWTYTDMMETSGEAFVTMNLFEIEQDDGLIYTSIEWNVWPS